MRAHQIMTRQVTTIEPMSGMYLNSPEGDNLLKTR